MPKVTIEFNLPEESEEYKITTNAMEYYCALCDLDNDLRNALKHGHAYKTIDEALEDTRRRLNEYADLG
jgi:hypothetical protein